MAAWISNYKSLVIEYLSRRRQIDGENGTLFTTLVAEVEASEGTLTIRQKLRLLDTCGKLIVEDHVRMLGSGQDRRFAYIPHHRRGTYPDTPYASSDSDSEPLVHAEEGPPESEPEPDDSQDKFPGIQWTYESEFTLPGDHGSNGHSDSGNGNSRLDSFDSGSENGSDNEVIEVCEMCGSTRKVSSIIIEPLL